MHVRKPDLTGVVDRDGVPIYYEVHGNSGPTVLLLPAWAIVYRRLWKAQVPYLANHYRVVTFDPRGNGASGRPADPAAYDTKVQVGDALAVLDAVGADRVVLIGTTLNVDGRDDYPLAQKLATFNEDRGIDEGWDRYNRHSFRRDFSGFLEFFIGQAFTDPHSTKQIEDGISWGRETTPEVLAATLGSRAGTPPEMMAATIRSLAPQVTCPVLVVHGDQDAVAPVHLGRSVAALLDAPLIELPGAGHCPQARHPVQINRLLREFIDRTTGTDGRDGAGKVGRSPVIEPAPALIRRPSSSPRVLFLSSPIGLGHARRDLAIADELRGLVPDAQIDWLAQDPVTRVLQGRDERIHPASARLASESAHIEAESGDHDLHVFEAVRRMDEILIANFMTFLDVVETERYDLVIGDEAWDVDHFLHEYPSVKHTRFGWLTDFVGYVPMAPGGFRERMLTADYNAEMIEHVERHPGVRDTSIFVGEPADVVSLPFGPGLPDIREWTEAHYEFAGYISGFDPVALGSREDLRAELGYRPDETVVIAAVGGSGVGAPLLRRIINAHPLASATIPNLRTVVVTGPRLDPDALPAVDGVDKRSYVPDLHRHLAACDLAVVQGGLTTTMELVAARRPFLYFPLRNHFEQQVHVRHRLERHRAGRAIDYASASPEDIASAMADELARTVDYERVDGKGGYRAAALLADLL